MNRVPLFNRRFVILLLSVLFFGVHEAQARKGFFLITHGDAVSELGKVKLSGELASIPELHSAKIGFHYDHFGIFWLDLWNWGGEYVIYNDMKEGSPITKAQAAVFLGVPESEIGTPLNYKCPYGLDILVGLGLLRFVPRWMRKNRTMGGGGGRPVARVNVDRPRWTPPPPHATPAPAPPPRVFPPAPTGSGPPPLPPEQP